MKPEKITFLKLAIFIIGMVVLGLCVFGLPRLAETTAERFPEFAHLQYPILIGLYGTVIPFFLALYQALKLLNMIKGNHAFSKSAVISLKHVKQCAIAIIIFYIIGMVYLAAQSALHPGIILMGLVIIFAALIITLFAAVLQELFSNALKIKSENDLTV